MSSIDYPVTAACETFDFLLFVLPFGEKILVLFCQLALEENREGFGYSALGYLVISQWLLVYNLAGKLQLVPTLFILKRKINRLSKEMLGFLTLDCSFNGRFDLLGAYGFPNASASSSTGKPSLNHGIPPCWLW